MPHDIQVAIVGSGPTGLMAAALLTRAGIRVRIIDQSATQAHESRAFAVQARSMELFLAMGLSEQLLESGLLATGAQIFVDGSQAAELNFDDIGRRDTPFPFVAMVPQWRVEEILVADLARLGVGVEHGRTLTGFTQDTNGVTLTVSEADGAASTLRCDFLVGADGAHSVVRKALGLTFEGAPYPQSFLLADCRVEWPLDYEHLKLFLRGSGFAFYLPLRGTEIGRVIAIQPEAGAMAAPQGAAPATLAEVESAFRDACGLDVTLHDPVWVSRYRVHHRGVDRYGRGRVFVAGDAAHIHSPAGGQGMNTGLQDAANLAWKLALVLKRRAPARLLESYHDERWPVGQTILRYTDRMFGVMTSQSGWIAGLRNRLVPILAGTLSRSGTARSRAFHFLSELGIRYEPGGFVADAVGADSASAFRDAVPAGHRAPDAAISRHRDVFDLLAGYDFHLLALSKTALGEREIATLAASLGALRDEAGVELQTHLVARSLIGRDPRLDQAESNEVFEAYGLDAATPQAVFLIRPDGYVAYRAGSLDLAGTRTFLARFTDAAT